MHVGIGYSVIYAKKKAKSIALDVAKVTVGVADASNTDPRSSTTPPEDTNPSAAILSKDRQSVNHDSNNCFTSNSRPVTSHQNQLLYDLLLTVGYCRMWWRKDSKLGKIVDAVGGADHRCVHDQ
ncbi:hypothetical protein L2E82_10683 [Cichorium intybus]|uniref:Uncharacterized protein n=1 Tax=Cichorium intybus TaxID=13427 RepID=A0ACB9GBV3_CICIN|nr:hypothetical protein L2E82_10683 [Cichorium intybus]